MGGSGRCRVMPSRLYSNSGFEHQRIKFYAIPSFIFLAHIVAGQFGAIDKHGVEELTFGFVEYSARNVVIEHIHNHLHAGIDSYSIFVDRFHCKGCCAFVHKRLHGARGSVGTDSVCWLMCGSSNTSAKVLCSVAGSSRLTTCIPGIAANSSNSRLGVPLKSTIWPPESKAKNQWVLVSLCASIVGSI